MIRYRRNSVTAPDWLVGLIDKQMNDNLLETRYNEYVNNHLTKIAWRTSDKEKWKSCKPLLGTICHWKCPYCDTGNIGQGDVEHFRPKNKDKYWWLAFTWENLLLACPDCNRVFKNDRFPRASGGVEARKPGDSLLLEKHLLINPLDEDPEPLFAYETSGNRVVIVCNSSTNLSNQERADECIKLFALNKRPSIHRARRKAQRDYRRWFALYRKAANLGIPSIIQDTEEALRVLSNAKRECAGMIRFFLGVSGLDRLIA